MESFWTSKTCCKQIIFDVKDNKLTSLKFINGCSGNLQGIARLAIGRDIDEIIATLSGIVCREKTSCPDQLCKALLAYKQKLNNPTT